MQTSQIPLQIFAFEHYRILLQNYCEENQTSTTSMSVSSSSEGENKSQQPTTSSEANKKIKGSKKIGRGHKKALVKWYSSKSEFELLSLMTKYKHAHSWTNKDLLKLIHMKPKNEG